jgi:hypothetical protein
MTDTPETDAMEYIDSMCDKEKFVESEFARKLERERDAAIAEAADRMEELCSELLFQKQLAEKYVEAGKICAKIYIARNITLSEKCVVSALAEIDKTYRTQHDGN